ncbi:MAG: hypothetical protein JW928_04160 [Candidatus Aureabacteria bacterium]|nr:hypothetical protein [Candidatus Auribacterota bacterium]
MDEETDVLEEVTIPDLDENVESVEIHFWHVDAGDVVEEGDDFVDIQIGKNTMTIKAPCSGILNEIFYDEGDEVFIDDVIATIEPER